MSEANIQRAPNKSRSTAPLPKGEPAKSKAGNGSAVESAEARSRMILAAMVAFRDGDFSVRLPADWNETDAQIAAAFNQTIAQKQRVSAEHLRLSATVGKEGRLKQRMSLPGAIGGWATDSDSINTLIDDLVRPTTEIARTIGAVAKGDLGQSMELEVDGRPLKGEFLPKRGSLVTSSRRTTASPLKVGAKMAVARGCGKFANASFGAPESA